MATSTRANSAWRAVRRASRFALPVVTLSSIVVWREMAYQARVHHRNMVIPAAGLALHIMSVLGIWLGCAAAVGWYGHDSRSGDDKFMGPPPEGFPWEALGMSPPYDSRGCQDPPDESRAT
jgi:hypothetical protein